MQRYTSDTGEAHVNLHRGFLTVGDAGGRGGGEIGAVQSKGEREDYLANVEFKSGQLYDLKRSLPRLDNMRTLKDAAEIDKLSGNVRTSLVEMVKEVDPVARAKAIQEDREAAVQAIAQMRAGNDLLRRDQDQRS